MSFMVMVAWRCDLCGHVWLARGPRPPALCARCRKRRWNTWKWDGKVELGDQEGLKVADVAGGVLKIVMVEGVGMAVVKVGAPAEADGHAGLSGKKKAPAKEKPPLRVRVDSYLTGVITGKNPPGHHGCYTVKLDQTGESILVGMRDFKLGEPGGDGLPRFVARKKNVKPK
jgi:hypothetical protein